MIQNDQQLLAIGSMLDGGKYRIEKALGSGGFGNTYLATDVRMDVRCVVKEFFMSGINIRYDGNVTVSVPSNKMTFESQKRKFMKEAQRLFQINNPHIVRVHSFFEEKGTAYYVMDYIEGESLSARIKKQGHPMPEAEVRNVLMQMLDALKTIHTQSAPLYHLDIKPGNIMMDEAGHVVLIDFGASKQFGSVGNTATTSTAMSYTPGYAPVEQIEQDITNIGPWTDFYALGATLYNLLTAQRPPSISSLSRPNAFQFPNGISEGMKKLIVWMMSLHAEQRPRTVEACLHALNSITLNQSWRDNEDEKTIVDQPVPENPQPHTQPQPMPVQQPPQSTNKILMGIIAALVVVVPIVGVVVLTANGNSGSNDDATTVETPVGDETVATSTADAADPALSISSSLEDEIRALIFKWDDLNKWGRAYELRSMYAERAKLYGQVLTRKQIEDLKNKAQYNTDGYSQQSNSITMVRIREDLIRCDFTKRTWSSKDGDNEYPSYLYFQRIDGEWLIVEESDKITDANLERRNK